LSKPPKKTQETEEIVKKVADRLNRSDEINTDDLEPPQQKLRPKSRKTASGNIKQSVGVVNSLSSYTAHRKQKSSKQRAFSNKVRGQKKRPLSNHDRKKCHSSGRNRSKDKESYLLTPNNRPVSKSKKNSRTSSLRDNSLTEKPYKRSVVNNFLSNTQIIQTGF